MDLLGQNICVFDLEIQNPIDGKEVTWSSYARMGVSVGCIYDYETGDYRVYFHADLWEMAARLNRAALVVGFNIKGFDNHLLRAFAPLRDDLVCYDMLEESRRGTGWKPEDRYPSGLKLDNHLCGTFGTKFMKTNHGAEAPWLYRTGRMGELVSYNIADVARERALFEYANTHGHVITDTHGPITVRRLEEVLCQ